MSAEQYSLLRANVSYLGRLLGETISDADGPEFLDKIEQIRLLSKSARGGNESDGKELENVLLSLRDDELLPVARAFSQFLNLANIADQHHTICRAMDDEFSATRTLRKVFEQLLATDKPAEQIAKAAQNLSIELVLTAHPTEITRRTLIHKHSELDRSLALWEQQDLTDAERADTDQRVRELIAQMWHTHDFRDSRPTPVDEAKWGFAVVENSLWQAVPQFIRRFDKTLFEATGNRLAIDAQPVKFSSWMGGDRDGNPNVTATVTTEVLLLARWQAADLYLRDLDPLIEELSMMVASDEVLARAGATREPYRALLKMLRKRLRSVKLAIEGRLAGESVSSQAMSITAEELWQPLSLCYHSLLQQGMTVIANGSLLDLIRRVRCFGVHLVQLDIRQDSDRHTDTIAELVAYLDMGDYHAWSESEKQQFLVHELNSKRPLIPEQWQPSADVKEVLDTFEVAANDTAGGIGCYVISMARQPSDILAVELLLKASGCTGPMPVVPLFETLDDLDRAAEVIASLLQIPGYSDRINRSLMVMIGYSDSAKDAGVLAAAWAQYQAQEKLLHICRQADVKLQLFHGRGGTVGRGGAPAHAALLSQPPGSLENGLRVTEQGEMIRTKLGLNGLAVKTLALYTSAILQANLIEPPAPKASWRHIMNELADTSCRSYRSFVRENDQFVDYFREATPERELAKLPLGSRPARRKTGGGIASLRAIPWIFAWTQNRLMLPAWLGAGAALSDIVKQGKSDELTEMTESWPFFATRLSMLEMVFAKADLQLSEFYDRKLVSPELLPLGKSLRQQLVMDQEQILQILGITELLEDQPWSRESIMLRNIYTDPLNVLQVELLRRDRQVEDDTTEKALMVTIAGIAAGMRNTG